MSSVRMYHLVQVEAVKLKERLDSPSEGSLAAVRFSEDGLVYRAKVSSWLQASMLVFLLVLLM